jgi:hypothetical protein
MELQTETESNKHMNSEITEARLQPKKLMLE